MFSSDEVLLELVRAGTVKFFIEQGQGRYLQVLVLGSGVRIIETDAPGRVYPFNQDVPSAVLEVYRREYRQSLTPRRCGLLFMKQLADPILQQLERAGSTPGDVVVRGSNDVTFRPVSN